MTNWIAIAILAGLVAALAFSAAIIVPTAWTLLFFFAPLPLFVAGLGYGLTVTLVAAAVGALALLAAVNLPAGILFFATAGLPAIVAVRLALLSRSVQTAPEAAPTLEWYPEGRIVLAIALLATLLVTALLLSMGPGIEQYAATFSTQLDAMLKIEGPTPVTPEQVAQVKGFLLRIFPFAAGAGWTAITFLNFRLALAITSQLKIGARPPIRFGSMSFPMGALGLLAAAVATLVLPGMPGLVGLAFLGAMLIAFTILGLAVLHDLLEGHSMRVALLAALYFAVLVLGLLPALPLVVLAVLDMVMGIRTRVRQAGSST